VDELIAMGSPRLKAALKARGMRAGGNAPLLAERLWWRCKTTLFADDSRNRIARQKSLRPIGAYSTVQPMNLAMEKKKFLDAALEYEAGRSSCPPADPHFEYAESDRCEKACPAVPCTCSRYKLWQDYGPADDAYLADALRIIQSSSNTSADSTHAHARSTVAGMAAAAAKSSAAATEVGVSGEAHETLKSSHVKAWLPDETTPNKATREAYGAALVQRTGSMGSADLGENERAMEEAVRRYLIDLGVEELIGIQWMDPKVCASASMITSAEPGGELRGKLHLVKGKEFTSTRLQGLLDHEIGTHFTRALNHHLRGFRHAGAGKLGCAGVGSSSKGGSLRELITEEGLATLNTLLASDSLSLSSPALSYYAQSRALHLGFSELFLELRKFVPSPASRWSYCFRCKRGLKDTSVPGAFGKDRAYLEGAIRILEQRHSLDFLVLHAAKVSLEDYPDIKRIPLPPFYHRHKPPLLPPPPSAASVPAAGVQDAVAGGSETAATDRVAVAAGGVTAVTGCATGAAEEREGGDGGGARDEGRMWGDEGRIWGVDQRDRPGTAEEDWEGGLSPFHEQVPCTIRSGPALCSGTPDGARAVKEHELGARTRSTNLSTNSEHELGAPTPNELGARTRSTNLPKPETPDDKASARLLSRPIR
jgi:hypothetical protein